MKKLIVLTALAIMTLAASGCGWRRGCRTCRPWHGWGASAANCGTSECEQNCSTCGQYSSGPGVIGGSPVYGGGFVPGGMGETFMPGNFMDGTVIGSPISNGLPPGATIGPPTLAPAPSN